MKATRRGRLVLGLGLATYLAAWAFGSKPLYPVAVGLIASTGLAWAWVRLANRPMRLRRRTGGGDYLEGADVPVDLELDIESPVAPSSVLVVQRVARLGDLSTVLEQAGGQLKARLVLRSLPRGRYAFEDARAVLEDPFGLERVEVPLAAGGAVLVYPRLVELDRLFSESGAHAAEGRRLLLRRSSGFDFHSVREYAQGESLRRVHWRTTARRGQLMVKELQDAPRDEVAVLLDGSASSVAGVPPDSSFELQVRAAGSILRAHVRRGRRSVLIVNGAVPEVRHVSSIDGEWREALELLAAVEPTAANPAAGLLADESSPAARALELTVVTSDLSPALVDRLIQRALARRSASLVFVDTVGFVARRGAAEPRPALLRLQAAGVPVAVLRRGDALAAKLSGPKLGGRRGQAGLAGVAVSPTIASPGHP